MKDCNYWGGSAESEAESVKLNTLPPPPKLNMHACLQNVSSVLIKNLMCCARRQFSFIVIVLMLRNLLAS